MKQFNYEQNGSTSASCNPAIPHYIVKLGKDNNGKEWLCSITPTGFMKHLMWAVEFDTNEEYWTPVQPDWNYDGEGGNQALSSPFLRPEVIYCAEGKWNEMREMRYHCKIVEYIAINKVLNDFVDRYGIK